MHAVEIQVQARNGRVVGSIDRLRGLDLGNLRQRRCIDAETSVDRGDALLAQPGHQRHQRIRVQFGITAALQDQIALQPAIRDRSRTDDLGCEAMIRTQRVQGEGRGWQLRNRCRGKSEIGVGLVQDLAGVQIDQHPA